MLPMFLENAHSVAMILHSMKIIRDAVQHLNPGQTPAMDQPLYAIGKQIQWRCPGCKKNGCLKGYIPVYHR